MVLASDADAANTGTAKPSTLELGQLLERAHVLLAAEDDEIAADAYDDDLELGIEFKSVPAVDANLLGQIKYALVHDPVDHVDRHCIVVIDRLHGQTTTRLNDISQLVDVLEQIIETEFQAAARRGITVGLPICERNLFDEANVQTRLLGLKPSNGKPYPVTIQF